tara:strand:- start:1118 stop:3040 length:1923 start_codon:yes stop_codon:yes gene_type:complete
MAKEVLELEIKSNTGKVAQEAEKLGKAVKETTTDFKDLNEQIDFQNKILNDLEKELIDLKAAQDAIPKGSFYANADGLNKKIADTTREIKREKIGLKELKQQQATATRETKKFTDAQKEQDKVVKDGIGNFQIMGVSLNGIKKTTGQIIPTLKLMFTSIKAGIASTGIGVLLLAFGSLVTYLTSTKEGMDKLNVVIAKVSAAFKVIKDRISGLGKIISNVFSKSLSETLTDVKENFEGIGEEMKKETKLAGELTKATHKLRDAENDFKVKKAETRKEIEKARLLAEDETKSAQERLVALRKALDLEQETSDEEVEMAKERLRIFEEDMRMSKHKAVDEKELADLKADVFAKETSSLRLQKRVMTEVNEMENKIASEEKARSDERQARLDAEAAKIQAVIDKETERVNKLITESADLLDEFYQSQLDAQTREENAVVDKYFAIIEGKRQLGIDVAELEEAQQTELEAIRKKFSEKEKDDAKKKTEEEEGLENDLFNAKMNIAKRGLGLVKSMAKEGSAVGKAAAIAQATVSGVQGVQNAFTTAQESPITAAFPAYPFIQAGLAGAFALKNIQAITAGTPPSGSESGGGPDVQTETPAPEMMSGRFELGGAQEPEPVQAYVVSDDVTNNQDKLAAIRRRATI